MPKIHNVCRNVLIRLGNESTADSVLQHLSPKEVTKSKWPSVEKDDNNLRYCIIYRWEEIMNQAAHPQLMLINYS